MKERNARGQGKKLWAALGGVAACVLLVGGLIVVHARPAQACMPHHWCGQCICPGYPTYDAQVTLMQRLDDLMVQWGTAAKESRFLSFITSVDLNTEFFSNSMSQADTMEKNRTETENAANNIAAAMEANATDAQVNAAANNKLVAAAGREAMDKATIDSDQFLCNVISTHDALPVMVEFSEMVESILTRGIDGTYRGPNDNGASGQYVYDLFRLSCGQIPNNDIKTQSLLDHPPAECAAPDALPGLGTDDMDNSADTLSRDNVYTLPPVSTQTLNVGGRTLRVVHFTPDPEDESQRRWVKAAQYCYNIAGPRPTPPYGRNALSATGMDAATKFAQCRTKQNALVSRCTKRLATLTRPDCSNEDMKPFCAASQQACSAAQDGGLTLGAAYADCSKGFSQYMLENVSNLLCGATRRIQSGILSNASEADKLETLTQCNEVIGSWESKLHLEDESFDRAIMGLQDIRDCYDEAQALQEGKSRRKKK